MHILLKFHKDPSQQRGQQQQYANKIQHSLCHTLFVLIFIIIPPDIARTHFEY